MAMGTTEPELLPMDSTEPESLAVDTISEPKLLAVEIGVNAALYLHLGSCNKLLVQSSGTVVIETELFKTLYSIIKNDHYIKEDKRGILIQGPPGTGKSTSCIYLWEKLKEATIPFLVCFIESLDPSFSYFDDYIHGFIEDHKIPTTEIPLNGTPKQIIYAILRNLHGFTKRVLFVDLGCTTKEEIYVRDLLQLAISAVEMKWHVVVSSSSGSGWKTQGDSKVSISITECLKSMTSDFQVLRSMNFTNKEAEMFINEFEIDITKLEKDIETGNNPRILRTFASTSSSKVRDSKSKYDSCMLRYYQSMRDFVRELLLIVEKREFSRSLEDCLLWLEHARHGVPVDVSLILKYKGSYLHAENLTYCIEEKGKKEFQIHMYIPSMYSFLIEELKERYNDKESNVHNHPVVRGYMFEEAFLRSEDLRTKPLVISAINASDTSSPRVFTFSSLTPAWHQQRNAITTNLVSNFVYHLRQKHSAIDAVCVADTETEKYLLLLQVSLSSYKDHVSKGIDIWRSVQVQERERAQEILEEQHVSSASPAKSKSLSISAYYQYLGGKIADDKVIYVYVSPKETNPPNNYMFLQELQDHKTRFGTPLPQFWYGFVHSTMKNTIELIENSF